MTANYHLLADSRIALYTMGYNSSPNSVEKELLG